ncbi:chromate transporter [Alishewanella longhuensis]
MRLDYTMLLPGPEAQQLATYIGWLLHGTKGALIAGLLLILPSFFMLSLLAWVYLAHGESSTLMQGVATWCQTRSHGNSAVCGLAYRQKNLAYHRTEVAGAGSPSRYCGSH